MTDKLLKYDVAIKATKKVWQMDIPECYTSDENTATFNFNITDLEEADLVNVIPNVYLYMHDGSFFQNGPVDGVDITGTKINYTMKGNEGKHSGIAKTQLVLIWENGAVPVKKLTSQLYEFKVVNGLETKVAVEVMIQDWTTLTAEAQVYLDQMAEKHAIADADHTRAANDHTTAVNDHTTAASDHTTALADHAVTADMIMNATNLVTNGDFSNGATGWELAAGWSVDNGKTTATSANSAYLTNQNTFANLNTNKHYIAFAMSNYVSGSILLLGAHFDEQRAFDGNGIKSAILIPKVNSLYFYPISLTAEIDNVLVIDLTAAFGAGNEPTAAQMDRLLTQFPNSWFDGTTNLFLAKWALDELRRLDNEKANKDQEAWITPTLLNGWDNLGNGLSAAAYMRDEFGFVHLKGVVVGGSTLPDTLIFTLPAGYVPTEKRMFCVNSNDTMGRVHIDPYVGVIVQKATSGFLQLDGITFKAEA